MGNDTTIEWTSATWNPVRGCTRVSEGCTNCYAERVAARFSGPGLPYEGLARIGKNGARWTGKVRMVPEHLADPLRWKKPRRIFVNSMSDLFHEGLSNEEIDQVWATMLLAPRHTFQILTKRPQRMREYLASPGLYNRVLDAADKIRGGRPGLGNVAISDLSKFPAKWIWLGVSVENQETADERIPLLLETPAAVRWVSYEPALGPVDFSRWMMSADERTRRQSDAYWKFSRQANAKPPSMADPAAYAPSLSWLVCGGESGPGARPFDLAWARSAIQQCAAAGVPVFTKQVGAHPFEQMPDMRGGYGDGPLDLSVKPVPPGWTLVTEQDRARLIKYHRLADRKGGTMDQWPEDIRVREFPR